MNIAEKLWEKHSKHNGPYSGSGYYIRKEDLPALIDDALSSQWIPIGERLPDFDEPVLWMNIEGNYHVEALDKDGQFGFEKITHWMKIPK